MEDKEKKQGNENIPIDFDNLDKQITEKKEPLPQKHEESTYAFSWTGTDSNGEEKKSKKNRLGI